MDGFLLSSADKVPDDKHKQITAGLCSLIGPVRIDGRHLKGLHERSVKVGFGRCGHPFRRNFAPRGRNVRSPVSGLLKHL